jgi:phage-related protein
LTDLRGFPSEVGRAIGYALHFAQMGDRHPSVKPLKGFGGRSVLEIVSDHEGKAFRAVYSVTFSAAVYVLHVFQKKSRQGTKTPRKEIALVKKRLRMAQEHHDRWSERYA